MHLAIVVSSTGKEETSARKAVFFSNRPINNTRVFVVPTLVVSSTPP